MALYAEICQVFANLFVSLLLVNKSIGRDSRLNLTDACLLNLASDFAAFSHLPLLFPLLSCADLQVAIRVCVSVDHIQ